MLPACTSASLYHQLPTRCSPCPPLAAVLPPRPRQVRGVESVSDLHVWSLTPGIPLLCAHVNLSSEADPTEVLHALTSHCRSLGIEHSTIQLMSCGMECEVC